MSHLQYFNYEGFGTRSQKEVNYSQAVRVGDIIHISGQGPWDPLTETIPPTLSSQFAQAFANVELALQTAGSKGWSEVYSVRMYLTNLGDEEGMLVAKYLKEYCPDHQPLLTAVAVKGLFRGMEIEIEVSAHVVARE